MTKPSEHEARVPISPQQRKDMTELILAYESASVEQWKKNIHRHHYDMFEQFNDENRQTNKEVQWTFLAGVYKNEASPLFGLPPELCKEIFLYPILQPTFKESKDSYVDTHHPRKRNAQSNNNTN